MVRMDVSRIYRNDPVAQRALYDLDQRLDCRPYSSDLAALRRAVRKVTGPLVYRSVRGGRDVPYDAPVYLHVAETDDPVLRFDVRASWEPEEIGGYDYIGSFPIGDAHSMQPDRVRDDRMYRHYVWSLRERRTA